MRSAEALANIGPAAVPALVKAMKNPNVEVRATAAKGLGKWAGSDEPAILALTNALHDKELQVRGAAALSLGELGAGAESAIPALREAAKDADVSVAEKAKEALSRVTAVTIGKKEEVPVAKIDPLARTVQPPIIVTVPKKKAPLTLHKLVKKIKPVAPTPPPPPPL